jgi:hypothetical protein
MINKVNVSLHIEVWKVMFAVLIIQRKMREDIFMEPKHNIKYKRGKNKCIVARWCFVESSVKKGCFSRAA